LTKVLVLAACFIEGGEDEASDDDLVVRWLARYRASGLMNFLVVWVLARYRVLALMKVIMPAACFIEGGDDEGSGDDLVARALVLVVVRYRVLALMKVIVTAATIAAEMASKRACRLFRARY
jgi:hypothetical protein